MIPMIHLGGKVLWCTHLDAIEWGPWHPSTVLLGGKVFLHWKLQVAIRRGALVLKTESCVVRGSFYAKKSSFVIFIWRRRRGSSAATTNMTATNMPMWLRYATLLAAYWSSAAWKVPHFSAPCKKHFAKHGRTQHNLRKLVESYVLDFPRMVWMQTCNQLLWGFSRWRSRRAGWQFRELVVSLPSVAHPAAHWWSCHPRLAGIPGDPLAALAALKFP